MQDRIRDLERAARRWRLVSVGAALLAVVAVVLAARPRGEVRAGRFALVNGRGEEVGSLGVDEHEQPRLALKLAATKGTVVVGSLAGDVGGFGVVGEKGTISLAVDGEGFPGLSVRSDRRSAGLVISREGEPTLLMVGADRENLSATPSALRLRRDARDVLALPGPHPADDAPAK